MIWSSQAICEQNYWSLQNLIASLLHSRQNLMGADLAFLRPCVSLASYWKKIKIDPSFSGLSQGDFEQDFGEVWHTAEYHRLVLSSKLDKKMLDMIDAEVFSLKPPYTGADSLFCFSSDKSQLTWGTRLQNADAGPANAVLQNACS